MIEFNEAYKLAEATVVDPAPNNVIVEAYESNEEWIFCPGNPDDEDGGADGGCFPIAVSKTTGKVDTIVLPSVRGFARLDAAEEMPITV